MPGRYRGLGVDAFIVIPNDVHGIIILQGGISASPLMGARSPRPALSGESARAEEGAVTAPLQTNDSFSGGVVKPLPTLGKIVAYFKYESAKRINVLRGTPGAAVWQRGYYEHIIRGGESLDRIRRYIAENPGRWAFDSENPDAAGPEPEAAW